MKEYDSAKEMKKLLGKRVKYDLDGFCMSVFKDGDKVSLGIKKKEKKWDQCPICAGELDEKGKCRKCGAL